jgi:hypothetical protein
MAVFFYDEVAFPLILKRVYDDKDAARADYADY